VRAEYRGWSILIDLSTKINLNDDSETAIRSMRPLIPLHRTIKGI